MYGHKKLSRLEALQEDFVWFRIAGGQQPSEIRVCNPKVLFDLLSNLCGEPVKSNIESHTWSFNW